MNFVKRHQRFIAPSAAAIALAAIVLFLPRAAAAGVAETIGGWIANIIYWIIQLLAQLLVVIINIMVAVAQYNNFLNAPAVIKGWAIVRDLSNMFFIVVLLIIAFGTIMKIESYRYNRLLARLIVMAVLVNFSKFIAGFFIDFSQVIMITFVNAWRDAAAGNITAALGLQDIIAISSNVPQDFKDQGAILSALLLGLFLLIVAVIVMTMITIVLILRIIWLWFLIVLSPLAYLLRTYPSTERYASRWWQEFGKYVVTGPVVAFLLWLSLAIMATPNALKLDNVIVSQKETTGISVPDTGSPVTATLTKIGESETLLSYIVAIMLLVGTLVITKELGVAGGNMAGQWAERIKKMPLQAAGRALRPITDRTIAPVRQYFRAREQRRQATIQERAAGLGVTVDRGLSRTVGLGGRVMAGAGSWIRGGGFQKGFQRGTQGYQQAQQRIDQFKQDRQQTLSKEMNITDPNLSREALLSMTTGMDNDRRLVAIRELIRRNMLKAGNTTDVALTKEAEQYAGPGQVGRQFWEDTHKYSADLAKKAFFDDFGTKTGQQRYESALQAGLTSTKLLAKGDQKLFTDQHKDESYLSSLIMRISRDEESLKRNWEAIPEEVRKETSKSADLTGEKDTIRQAFVRATGEIGRAFSDYGRPDATGKRQRIGFDNTAAQDYVNRLGGDELMKRMTANAAEDRNVVQLLNASPNVRAKHLKDFRDRGSEFKEALLKGLEAYKTASVGARALTNDRADPSFKLDDWIRKNTFNVSKGKDNLYDLDTDEGRGEFDRFTAQAEARDFAEVKDSAEFKDPTKKAQILRTIGLKAKLKTLADYIVDEDYDVGKAALDEFVKELEDAAKNRPGTAETLGIQSRGMNMRRDLNLSGLVSIDPDLLRKKRGGAATTGSTPPAGPAPYRGTTRGFTAPLTGPAPSGPTPSVTPPTTRSGGTAPTAGAPPLASARPVQAPTGPATFGVVGGAPGGGAAPGGGPGGGGAGGGGAAAAATVGAVIGAGAAAAGRRRRPPKPPEEPPTGPTPTPRTPPPTPGPGTSGVMGGAPGVDFRTEQEAHEQEYVKQNAEFEGLPDRHKDQRTSAAYVRRQIVEFAQSRGLQHEQVPGLSGEAFDDDAQRIIAAQAQKHIDRLLLDKARGGYNPAKHRVVSDQTARYLELVRQAQKEGDIPQDISAETVMQMVEDNVWKLAHQDRVASENLLGDHGIRHLAGHNITMTEKIFDELERHGQPVRAVDRLMSHQVMIDHDLGYAMEPVREEVNRGNFAADRGHNVLAAKFLREESGRAGNAYARIFSPEQLAIMHEGVLRHDSSDVDFRVGDASGAARQKNIQSAIHVADNSHAFEDKLPELLYSVPDALKTMRLMKAAGETGNAEMVEILKQRLVDIIGRSEDFSDDDKQALSGAVQGLSDKSYKFSVGRIFGNKPEVRMDDDGALDIKVNESAIHQEVVALFDQAAYDQLRKFAADFTGRKKEDIDLDTDSIIGDRMRITLQTGPNQTAGSTDYQQKIEQIIREKGFVDFSRRDHELSLQQRRLESARDTDLEAYAAPIRQPGDRRRNQAIIADELQRIKDERARHVLDYIGATPGSSEERPASQPKPKKRSTSSRRPAPTAPTPPPPPPPPAPPPAPRPATSPARGAAPRSPGVTVGAAEREEPAAQLSDFDPMMKQFEQMMQRAGEEFTRSVSDAGAQINEALNSVRQQDAARADDLRKQFSALTKREGGAAGWRDDFELKRWLRELTNAMRDASKKGGGGGSLPKPPPKVTGGETL